MSYPSSSDSWIFGMECNTQSCFIFQNPLRYLLFFKEKTLGLLYSINSPKLQSREGIL